MMGSTITIRIIQVLLFSQIWKRRKDEWQELKVNDSTLFNELWTKC